MELDSALKDLSLMVGKGEKVLWFSKPDKLCFVLESIFNPLLPFALVWLIIDSLVIFGAFVSGINEGGDTFFIIPFMLLHLMPVWIYLGGVLFTSLRYKNTAYVVTTGGVYISGGIFARTFFVKPFAELSHVSIHRGILDQIIGVGDVIMSSADVDVPSNARSCFGISICDIVDYQRVFKMIKDLQTDVYSDTMFPNAFRPEENPGYNTQYVAKREWFK